MTPRQRFRLGMLLFGSLLVATPRGFAELRDFEVRTKVGRSSAFKHFLGQL